MELVLVLVLVSARVSILVYIGIRIDTRASMWDQYRYLKVLEPLSLLISVLVSLL